MSVHEITFVAAPLLLAGTLLPVSAWQRFLRVRLFGPAESVPRYISRLPSPFLYALLFTWGFGIAAALWVFVRQPEPHVHDEASYLLAADTFARGHWTNPALPAAIRAHFEALHIIVAPSYMSKYPPGQGLVLALGIVIGGNPAIGLWIVAGLVCAGAFYALSPLMPRRFAVLGGVLAAMHPAVLKWTQSFWGGNLSLVAGLLLVGAVGRLVAIRRGARAGAVSRSAPYSLSLALAILANCRPFEGLVAASLALLPVMPVLWHGLRTDSGVWLRRVLLPAGMVLGVTAALMCYYNSRVTGNPLRMPYAVHEDTYGVVPLFLFQRIKPVPPTLRHDSMRFINAYTCVYGYWGERNAAINIWRGIGDKTDTLVRSAFQCFDPSVYWLDTPERAHPLTDPWKFVPALLLVPGLYLALRGNRVARYAALGLAGFVFVISFGTFINPHYGAPVGGFELTVWAMAWRYTRALRRESGTNRRLGLAISRAFVLLYVLSTISCIGFFGGEEWQWTIQDRRPVRAALDQVPGEHLVLVYYGATNVKTSAEWVYNGSDLASQRVVWARYLSPAENAGLIRYFAGRQVWFLDATVASKPRLYRFDAARMAALPFPEPRVIDPGVVARLRAGLPTRPKHVSGVAALPAREQALYHEQVRERSRVRRLLGVGVVGCSGGSGQ